MAETYEGLNSLFPEQYDNPMIFQDVDIQTKPLVDQYYEHINSGKFTEANALLKNNENLQRCIMTATTFQKMYDMNLAIQRFLKEEFQKKFEQMTSVFGTTIICQDTEPEPQKGVIWLKPVE